MQFLWREILWSLFLVNLTLPAVLSKVLEPPNIALGKPATQSSTEGDMVAARSVDGNVDSDPNGGSCSRTRHERRPWWSVNLKDYYDVHNVTITNIGGSNHVWRQMRGFSVYVDASPGGVDGRKACVDRAGALGNGQTTTFTCATPVSGRHVTIELYPEWPEKLNFCEVQVKGVPSVKVHGGWGAWSEYGDCSSTCGSGVKTRGRFCNAPTPENGGNSCPGIPVENADCHMAECPGTGVNAQVCTLGDHTGAPTGDVFVWVSGLSGNVSNKVNLHDQQPERGCFKVKLDNVGVITEIWVELVDWGQWYLGRLSVQYDGEPTVYTGHFYRSFDHAMANQLATTSK